MKSKNKIVVYVMAIVAVVLLLIVARKLQGDHVAENGQKGTEVNTEQGTELVSLDTEADKITELKQGYFFAEEHSDGQDYNIDGDIYLTYKSVFYTVGCKDSGNKDAADAINVELERYIADVKAELVTCQEEAKAHYKEVNTNEGKDFYEPYSFQISTKLLRNDERVFSVIIYTASFTGGQHSNIESFCMNFNAKTGQPIQLKDMISPLSSASLEAWENDLMLEIYGQAEKKEDLYDDYKEKLFDTLMVDGSYALTADGLQFVADPYEIAPYAAGMIVFTIPTEDIQWFNEDYAFASAISKSKRK